MSDDWIDDIWDPTEDEKEPEPTRKLRAVGPEDASPFVMKGKKIAPTVGNAVVILVGSREWSGLRYDKFRGEPSIIDPPPVLGIDPPDSRLDSYASTYVAQWLGRRKGLIISDDAAHRAAEMASKAKGRSFHPVREYLGKLRWDGTSRLDSFVAQYLGGEFNVYTSAAWRCWMISAVARVMQPGCQVHHVPILEGDQGSGKSTAIRMLLPDPSWMNDSKIKIGDKDGMDALRGHWIVEFAELESLSNRESANVKAFISSSVDTFRKAYGKDTEKFPRQCVMIGSVNPEEGYLKDPTGNRRFWPIKTGKINTEAIATDRDQLWAEACFLYQEGKPWHFTDTELIEISKREQEDRQVVDPWEEIVVEWISHPTRRSSNAHDGLTTKDVLTGALQVPLKEQDRANATRVGTILRKNDFHPRGRSRPRRYFKECDYSEEEIPF